METLSSSFTFIFYHYHEDGVKLNNLQNRRGKIYVWPKNRLLLIYVILHYLLFHCNPVQFFILKLLLSQSWTASSRIIFCLEVRHNMRQFALLFCEAVLLRASVSRCAAFQWQISSQGNLSSVSLSLDPPNTVSHNTTKTESAADRQSLFT